MSDQPMGFHVPPGGSGHGPPFAPQNPTGSCNIYMIDQQKTPLKVVGNPSKAEDFLYF